MRLGARRDDVWCCVLRPSRGGIGIHARAHLTGSRVINMTWIARLRAHGGDARLARAGAGTRSDAPRTPSAGEPAADSGRWRRVRRVERARLPVLASYGMSECASTVAVEGVLLTHLEVRAGEDQRLAFRGASC